MVSCVAFGSEKEGKFYVQTCCSEEHNGGKCDCKSFGENFSKGEAKKLAEQKAKELNVPLKEW